MNGRVRIYLSYLVFMCLLFEFTPFVGSNKIPCLTHKSISKSKLCTLTFFNDFSANIQYFVNNIESCFLFFHLLNFKLLVALWFKVL